ncbi:MAG: cytochrome c oxidase subunit II [Xanthobacteraceae bacterium]|nr:cytochrome c oxidase subunit II [Xanthobacteraceae bacterium]
MTTMLGFKRLAALAVVMGTLFVGAGVALAQSAQPPGLGQPVPWQLGLQPAATPVMEWINWFHNGLLITIVLISAFVLALLIYVMVRFNARANPTPSRTTHNTFIEVVWTLVPVIILVAIAIPSFRLLFYQLTIPAMSAEQGDVTIKAVGRQWYWVYSYPDHGNFEFESRLACDAARKECKAPRLLAVDNEVVVPVNKNVRVITTGGEVIHAFAVPAFGIKIDSIPGRINETWFRATRVGIYYGQCSELCGKDHAYMPIAVRVVPEDEFKTWVEGARKKFARDDAVPATTVATAEQSAGR